MKPNKQKGRKVFSKGVRFFKEDTNDDETYPNVRGLGEIPYTLKNIDARTGGIRMTDL